MSVLHGGAVPVDFFKSQLRGPTKNLPGHYLTYAPDAEEPYRDGSGLLDGDVARFFPVEIVDEDHDPQTTSATHGPATPSETTIGVIGVGSIGGAAAEGLAGYGVEPLPRRLRPARTAQPRPARPNRARHRTPQDVRDRRTRPPPTPAHDAIPTTSMSSTTPTSSATSSPGGTPSSSPPTVSSHVSPRTGSLSTPRSRPCSRACSTTAPSARSSGHYPGRGSRLHDLRERAPGTKPGIDLDYGTGTPHRPMTAIGSDLAYVGRVAAETASPPSSNGTDTATNGSSANTPPSACDPPARTPTRSPTSATATPSGPASTDGSPVAWTGRNRLRLPRSVLDSIGTLVTAHDDPKTRPAGSSSDTTAVAR